MVAIIAATVIAYCAMATSSIAVSAERPPVMPFRAYRALCQFGRKRAISDLPIELAGLYQKTFVDARYRVWSTEARARGTTTSLEYRALVRQRHAEMYKALRGSGA